MSSWAHHDIQTAIAFVTKWVKEYNEDEWGKLKRVLAYLNGARMLELTLLTNDIGAITWYVDTSYVVYNDCKGQLGRVMVLGKVATTSFSYKQKLNPKSSSEAELIGVDDALTQVLWTKYFLEAQGFTISTNVIIQDNVNAIKLENNGKASSLKNQTYPCVVFFIKAELIVGRLV